MDKAVFTSHEELGGPDTLQAIVLVFVDDLRIYMSEDFEKKHFPQVKQLFKFRFWEFDNY